MNSLAALDSPWGPSSMPVGMKNIGILGKHSEYLLLALYFTDLKIMIQSATSCVTSGPRNKYLFFSNFNIQNELILTFEIVIFHFLDTACSPSYGVYISQLIVCCCSHGITVCVSCADQEGVHGSRSPPLPPPGKSQHYSNC